MGTRLFSQQKEFEKLKQESVKLIEDGNKLELENSSLIDQLSLFENDLGLVQKAIKEEYKLVEDANLKRK